MEHCGKAEAIALLGVNTKNKNKTVVVL